MNIIGLTHEARGLHDTAAVLVLNGEVVFAETEERISRLKHDGRFPRGALDRLAASTGIEAADVDCFAIAWPHQDPLRSLKVLAAENARGVVRTAAASLAGSPLRTIGTALDLAARERPGRASPLVAWGASPGRILEVDHHRAHAASAFRVSGFDDAMAVTLDGIGPEQCGAYRGGAAFLCRGPEMTEVETVPAWASLGCFYAAMTSALGFKSLDGEGKTMGLAAFGDPAPARAAIEPLAPAYRDGAWTAGRWWTDGLLALSDGTNLSGPRWMRDHHQQGELSLFARTQTARLVARLIRFYGRPNVAAAAQAVLEDHVLAYFKSLHDRYGARRFALAGGIFLNVKLNQRLSEQPWVDDLFIQPHAGDSGTALGAALEAAASLGSPSATRMTNAALGSSFSEAEMEEELRRAGASLRYERPIDIAAAIAERLTAGVVVGYFEGRAEWGPRALGQRSVIADPRRPEVKARINEVLKRRDWFMPFAPSILHERAAEYLVHVRESPFMILADHVTARARSEIAAAIHVDGTARPHLVRREEQPAYHAVISAFAARTGVGAVLNTSFNRHGVPIVDTPADAIEHLQIGAVDELALGPFLVRRAG